MKFSEDDIKSYIIHGYKPVLMKEYDIVDISINEDSLKYSFDNFIAVTLYLKSKSGENEKLSLSGHIGYLRLFPLVIYKKEIVRYTRTSKLNSILK